MIDCVPPRTHIAPLRSQRSGARKTLGLAGFRFWRDGPTAVLFELLAVASAVVFTIFGYVIARRMSP